jgi:hypothetical protein
MESSQLRFQFVKESRNNDARTNKVLPTEAEALKGKAWSDGAWSVSAMDAFARSNALRSTLYIPGSPGAPLTGQSQCDRIGSKRIIGR